MVSWSGCRSRNDIGTEKLSQEVIDIEDTSNEAIWLLCPVCKSKTRIMVREDTELKNFPLFCPKCKHTSIVNVQKLNMTVIKEPDAKTQSR